MAAREVSAYAKTSGPRQKLNPRTQPAPPLPFDPAALLSKIGEDRTLAEYRKGKVIFAQGDPPDAVFYLRRGKIKLTVVSDQGKEAVLALLSSDTFFGEECLTAQPFRMATATALTPCSVLRVEKATMARVLHVEPAFAEQFIVHLLTRFLQTEEDLLDQLFNSAEKRLARALLVLAGIGRGGAFETLIPKISQETLAEMIGTTRPRVNYFMNKFRRLGFIDYSDSLKVHSTLLNVLLHD